MIIKITKILFNVLRNRGIQNFLYELFDIIFIDLKFQTLTYIRKKNKINNYVPYYSIVLKRNIKKLIKLINLNNSYFVDLGSGKGRILLAMSNLSFIKIIGIEKDKSLFKECKKNI